MNTTHTQLFCTRRVSRELERSDVNILFIFYWKWTICDVNTKQILRKCLISRNIYVVELEWMGCAISVNEGKETRAEKPFLQSSFINFTFPGKNRHHHHHHWLFSYIPTPSNMLFCTLPCTKIFIRSSNLFSLVSSSSHRTVYNNEQWKCLVRFAECLLISLDEICIHLHLEILWFINFYAFCIFHIVV